MPNLDYLFFDTYPSWGISVGGRGKNACFYTNEYINTTRDKIKTNQMDLIKERNK